MFITKSILSLTQPYKLVYGVKFAPTYIQWHVLISSQYDFDTIIRNKL